MNHLPPMLIDLTIILGAAAISTLIFSWLRQPVVLGYLIAGFLAGPHFSFWPTVIDKQGVALWAELGVIFLLFGLGLEFSFKKLAKVGKSAFIAAIFEIITMTAFGYLLGQTLRWTTMDSIYLGVILSMSSTTIILRAFDEAGMKRKAFASLVFGILIVEDLMAVLLMVILSAISSPGSLSNSSLVFQTARLVFFLLIWFLVGIYLLPSVLTRIRNLLSNEILLVVSISLCFLMVVLATKSNFSAALGAFVMGSILAETKEGERIEHLMSSVKNLFAAVFFVSVGMMIDPDILQKHFGVIALITFITIVGKLLGSSLGAILSGRNLRDSTRAGMSLAQIGEFSFIIAGLGVSLKVVSDFLYPIVVAVSAVTTFTTPYMIRHSDSLSSWIEKRLPNTFLDALTRYERAMDSDQTEGAIGLLWRTYGMLLLLNSVVVLAIGLASAHLLLPSLASAFGNTPMIRFLTCVVTLVACSPFFFAIVLKIPRVLPAQSTALWRLRQLQLGIFAIRALIAMFLLEATISQFTTSGALPLTILVATPLIIFVFRKSVGRFYTLVEGRFLKNLNAKDLAALESLEQLPQLAPWGARLGQIILSPNSKVAGKTLLECQFRTKTGATIGMIDRGSRRIFAPSSTERLLPTDEIFLIGTEEQLEAAQLLLGEEVPPTSVLHDEVYNLESVLINAASPFANKSIKEIGIGETFEGLVVGIERKGDRILNPESTYILLPGDLIWVFGHRTKIHDLRNS